MLNTEEIKYDGMDITKDVWSYLATQWEDSLARAEEEQVKLMQAEYRLTGGVRKNLPHGRIRMKICPEVINFWENKIPNCWTDKSFLDWLERRFGDLVKIKSKSGNVVV